MRNAAILGVFLIVTLACYLPHTVESFVGIDLTSYEPVLLTPRPLQTALEVLVDIKGTIVPGYYAPFGSLSLIVDRMLAGSIQATPKVTFVFNLSLHCLNGLLMWWLLRSLGFGEGVALASVFVFLIHPMQVSVVAWFAERKTLLAATLYLLCYVLFAKSGFAGSNCHDPSATRHRLENYGQTEEETMTGPQFPQRQRRSIVLYGMSLLAFVMGLLAKPTVAVFPVAWMWGMVFRREDEPGIKSGARTGITRRLPNLRAALVPVLPFFAVAILAGSVALLSETNPPNLPVVERMPIVGAAVLFYLHKVIAPVDLMYLYPRWSVDVHSVWWWLPFLGLGAALILLFRCRRYFPSEFTWGVGNFLIPLLPAAGVISFGFFQYSYVANHLAYLSMVGAAACVGSVFVAAVQRVSMPLKALVIIFGTAYSVFLVGQTWSQASTWESPTKLWQDNVNKCPACIDAQGGLGGALLDAGRSREAIPHLEVAVASQPGSATDRYNLGEAKAHLGDLRGAMDSYLKVLELKPNHARAHIGLGVIFKALGDNRRAADEFQRAVALSPYLLPAQYNLAVAFHQMGEIGQAIVHYQEVLRLDPQNFMTHNNIGAAYLSLGLFEKAQAHFKKALEIRPDSEFALKNLERVREAIRKKQETSPVDAPQRTPSGPASLQ